MAMTGAWAHGLLLDRGWTPYTNSAENLSGWRHPNYDHGMKLADTDKARAVQRGWDDAAAETRWLKRPRYHWGLDAALAMGAEP